MSLIGAAVVDVTVKSADGLDLHGWVAVAGLSHGADAQEALAELKNGRPVVLYFSGNGGNRSLRRIPMKVLGTLNSHVMLVDYRGYGDNKGTPTESNLARDARATWNHLTQELGVAPHHIVIYGESLGGGVATRLASDLCREGIEPGGLIVQSTFDSLVAVAQFHFPIVPVSMVLVDRFSSVSRIPHVTCPILQIHGNRDSIVPLKYGQRLFDAVPKTSSRGIVKRQLILPGIDHNDVYSAAEEEGSPLVRELKKFLDEVVTTPAPTLKSSSINARMNDRLPETRANDSAFDWTIVVVAVLSVLAIVVWKVLRAKP